MNIEAKRLESGYWRLQGNGPCEWAQPPFWPCDEKTLRDHAFPEASESFIRECIKVALAACYSRAVKAEIAAQKAAKRAAKKEKKS